MRREVEVAIVGGGVMGLATARALAAAGRSVAVVEQFRVGHARGSSHGTSRIFRVVYDRPRYVWLARAALDLWREAERETGTTLLTPTTSLDVGGDLGPFTRALDEAGADYELVDGAAVARRYPRLRVAPDEPCLLQRDGGIAHADAAVRAFREAATARSAAVLEESRVLELAESNGHVDVRGEGFELRAQAAVVAAGAWSNRLLEPLGLDLELGPTRETVVYVAFEEPLAVPTVIDRAAGVDQSGLPRGVDEAYGLAAPGVGLKAGVHKAGGPTDPDEDAEPDDATVREALAWIGRTYDAREPTLLRAETCIYTNAADDSFVLERRGRIVVGAACSGHGFKFAPEIGRQLAELASEPLA